MVTDSQLPEESMIMNLAAMENQLAMNGTPRREDEAKFTTPPQFLRPLLPQIGLKENERAKFETFVQPANDPSLSVEWYKDGEPLKTGTHLSLFWHLKSCLLAMKGSSPSLASVLEIVFITSLRWDFFS